MDWNNHSEKLHFFLEEQENKKMSIKKKINIAIGFILLIVGIDAIGYLTTLAFPEQNFLQAVGVTFFIIYILFLSKVYLDKYLKR